MNAPRRWTATLPLGVVAAAVYLFLYAPILVLAALAFNASRPAAGADLVLDLVGDGARLPRVGAGEKHEVVGVRHGLVHAEDDDVLRLLVGGRGDDVAGQALGGRGFWEGGYGWSFVDCGALKSSPTMTWTVPLGRSGPSRTTPRPSIARMSRATGRVS